MRQLGLTLGVEAMSLYRHVANKAALLDGVHETILSEMHLPDRRGGWRAAVRKLASAFRDVLLAHPQALPLFAARPAITAGSLAYVERGLSVLESAPLQPHKVVGAFQLIVSFVIAHTSLARSPPDVPARSSYYAGLTSQAYPTIARHLPHITQRNDDDEFALGLQIIIDGIEHGAMPGG